MSNIGENKKEYTRRVTNNFKRLRNYDSSELQSFNSWKAEMINNNVPVVFDKRNNIYCVAPTMDFEMYYNYLQYLNESYNEWLSYGYFDMGMVPYIMWPSFIGNATVVDEMRNVAKMANVTLIDVPSVSVLKPSYTSYGTDYWIFREDLYKIAKYMESVSPIYKFGIAGPEDATLSKFIKPLADIAVKLRGGN